MLANTARFAQRVFPRSTLPALGAVAVPQVVASLAPRYQFSTTASSDSHDDFKPRVKVDLDDPQSVQDAIKQVRV